MQLRSFERRVVTVLSADAIGYSRLTGLDEDATHSVLSRDRKIIFGLIDKYRGRIFSRAGDGLMAEFPDPLAAVRCALQIEAAIEEANGDLPPAFYLMEEPQLETVFHYSVFRARKARVQRLHRRYQLGDSGDHGPIADDLLRWKEICLSDADRRRLVRKLMEVEIKALEDLTAGNEASFDGIVERQATVKTRSSLFRPQSRVN